MPTCTCHCHCVDQMQAGMAGVQVELRDAVTDQMIAQATADSNGKASMANIEHFQQLLASWNLNGNRHSAKFGIVDDHDQAASAIVMQQYVEDAEAKINVRVNYSGKSIKIQKVLAGKDNSYYTIASGTSVGYQYVAFGGLPAGTYRILVNEGNARTVSIVVGQTTNQIFNISAK